MIDTGLEKRKKIALRKRITQSIIIMAIGVVIYMLSSKTQGYISTFVTTSSAQGLLFPGLKLF